MLATKKKSTEQFLAGGSELSELINAKDWSMTPLGPIDSWPQSLKTSVNLILNSQHPMWIGWGPEATFLYNDAYIQVLSRAKHPWALGVPASVVWAEIWDVCGPLAAKVFDEGKATFVEDVQLFMNRGDYIEETYYSFSYSPIYDEAGKVAGLFCPSAETTAKVLHTRRLNTLSELASNALLEKTTHAACGSAFATLRKNIDDIPFAVLYLVDGEKKTLTLEQITASLPADVVPETLSLNFFDDEKTVFPIQEVIAGKASKTASLHGIPGIPPGCAGNKVTEAIVLPVSTSGQETPIGILIAGVSPCRKLDSDYRAFYELLSNQIGIAIQNARAAEEERKRVEMLAEIDKAKTAFFSNVSHEFRTPLTLLLGPLEDLLKEKEALPSKHQEGLESSHRNAMRLYRLVNTLLDFSRIEAGRLAASFSPVNLAEFTADLASNFRSVIESVGLHFEINCENIGENVYVDRQLWEKIVFNLLSNAFKYTLKGKVSVHLTREGNDAVLRVIDTGIGIPADELPRMFERFHRVKNANGRTFEGTGIGLSLVKELVTMHHGSIEVQSRHGEGSTFTVKLPLGRAHLTTAQISTEPLAVYQSSLAGVYVKEIESLLGSTEQIALPRAASRTGESNGQVRREFRVLVVDDNVDMRQYIRRLLSEIYEVEDAENGKVALEKMKTFRPNLVVSDIMMPVMDGFELLHAMKKSPPLARIPVIFLSARAGEEARIEGYEVGADDYLVKPFSANELLARVKAQISISRIRQNAERHLRNFFQQAPLIIVVMRGPDFVVEVANEKLLQYWGKTQEQTLHKPLLEVLPELKGQGLIELLTRVLTKGERVVEDERPVPLLRNGKMETTYVSYVYEPLRDEEGNITHVMVVANEVTDSVMARKRIEASEAKFRNLVIQAPVGITIMRGREFIVEVVNDHYLSLVNRKHEEMEGRPILDVIPVDDKEPLRQLLTHVYDTGESYFGSEFPVSLIRDGQVDFAYYNFVYQPLKEDDKVVAVVAVVVEVTEIVKARKVAQELANQMEQRVEDRTHELKLSNQKLEASNRELEQFAYIASHDLQEPLRKIQTFSELLNKHLDDRKQVARYLDKIDTSASRMSVLIRDVLNYSRLTRMDEPFRTVDLNQILENVKSDFELLIEETNATIEHASLPSVTGVPLQLHQLFANLIGNSLKFSKENPLIRISSESVGGETHPALIAGKRYVKLVFEDNGIGFEQEYADKIFVIFQRLNYSGRQSGTGIGLALCKKIVENHHGYIEAKGQMDQGAKFTVFLPE